MKVGMSKFSDPPVSSVDKLGVAASTSQVSPQDLLHKQQVSVSPHLTRGLHPLHLQVQAFVSQLTPEQIALKQQQVISHVQQEAVKQGLSAAEAEAMLVQTLEYNGLPQVNSNPITGAINDLFKIGSNTVNKIGLPAPTASSQSTQELIPGLPVPGTLEHTVTLALFNAQQYLNKVLSPPSQPAIDNKLGVAAGAEAGGGEAGIISAVSSLPSSLTNAAVQVLKFVGDPPSSATASASASGTPGQSYSEVVTGVDPTYAALGVLTTGALASVAYSYVASDPDIASSATDLALGAVDAIARNDIVQNIANTDIVKKATNAIGSLTGMDPNEETYNISEREPTSYYYYDYDKFGYSDYDYDQNYQYMEAKQRFSKKDPLYPTEEREKSVVPDNIEWYEPTVSDSKDVPYVAYIERHNPWALLSQKKPTDHLYRSLE